MKDYIQQSPPISHVIDGHTRASKQPPVNQIIQSYSSNIIQCKPAEDEQLNNEIAGIINMLEGLLNSEICISNPETFEEVTNYIIKSKEIMDGNDIQAKEALIESSKNGTPSTTKDEGTTISNSSSSQMKVSESHPIQRVGGLVIGGGLFAAGLIGYGIYKLLHRHTPIPVAGPPDRVQAIPTRRKDYGQKSILGGIFKRKLTNDEIVVKVKEITDSNHRIIYEQICRQVQEGNIIKFIAQHVQAVRDNPELVVGDVCHELTRYLVKQITKKRPTEYDLKDKKDGKALQYSFNGRIHLEGLLTDEPPGTTVYLGEKKARAGHSFLVVGVVGGHVIVAERHPANPQASLKYASAVEAEIRLAYELHPKKRTKIKREFSGRLILHHSEPVRSEEE